KALIDIVSENDDMKEDAEIIHEKYKSKLASLDETEHQIKIKLDARLTKLDEQLKSTKMLLFDAKVQYKSNEISDDTFETVKTCTTEIIEHITHETAEISNVKRRIADLDAEVTSVTEPPQKHIQESAVSYLGDSEQEVQSKLPEVPSEPVSYSSEKQAEESLPKIPTTPKQVKTDTSNYDDWLTRMEAQ
ncbi:MAG: CdvA-like protein, partial [Nitrosarchaeum sp.]